MDFGNHGTHSHTATRNTSQHGSIQYNGHCYYITVSSTEQLASLMGNSREDPKFSFGPFVEEQDEDVRHSIPVVPAFRNISASQHSEIKETGNKILQAYEQLLKQIPRKGQPRSYAEQSGRRKKTSRLTDQIEDQYRRLGAIHSALMKSIQKLQFSQTSEGTDTITTSGIAEEEAKFSSNTPRPCSQAEAIRIIYQEILTALRVRVQQSLEELNASRLFRAGLGKSFHQTRPRDISEYERILKHVASLERLIARCQGIVRPLVYQPRSLQSPAGLKRLRIASQATRTLYQCLRNSCPLLADPKHNHCALVGLVPDKEDSPSHSQGLSCATYLIAIESTISPNDYLWFEVESSLPTPGEEDDGFHEHVIEVDDSHGPEALKSDMNGAGHRRESLDSGYATELQLLAGRHHTVQVCLGSLAQGSDDLAMKIGTSHKIVYMPKNCRPADATKCIVLAGILGRDTYRGRSASQSDLSRSLRPACFQIATRIAEATLRYGWKDWHQDAWTSKDVLFYRLGEEFQPFLSIHLIKDEEAKRKKGSFLRALGVVLLELGLWKRVSDTDSERLESEVLQLITCTTVGFTYTEVVLYCLSFSKTNSYPSDEKEFQKEFYERAILPLRSLAIEQAKAATLATDDTS